MLRIKVLTSLLLILLMFGGVLVQCALTPILASAQAYEDFTTYTTVDSGGNFSVSASQIAFINVEYSSTCYTYRDFGVGYFGDNWDVYLDGVVTYNGLGGEIVLFELADQVGDLLDNYGNGASFLALVVDSDPYGGVNFKIREAHIFESYEYYGLSGYGESSPFYCELQRFNVGNTSYLLVDIYGTAEDRAAKINAYVVVEAHLHSAMTYQYEYPISAIGGSPTGYNSTGIISNLELVSVGSITPTPTPTPGEPVVFTIGVIGNGTTSPAPGEYATITGTTVDLAAIPGIGYDFAAWSGNVNNYLSADTFITLTGNDTVIATFTPTLPTSTKDLMLMCFTLIVSIGLAIAGAFHPFFFLPASVAWILLGAEFTKTWSSWFLICTMIGIIMIALFFLAAAGGFKGKRRMR